MSEVLVIDDEAGIRNTLSSILEDERYRIHIAEDAIEGISMLQKFPIGLVFLDVWLPKLGGMTALEQIKKEWPEVEVVIISGHANIDMAVRAVKLGAFDFLEKPLSLEKILTVTRNAFKIRALRVENTDLKKNLAGVEIIGSTPEMDKVRELINLAAETDARILISGESGTGKELVAQDIHRKSKRSAKAFIELNCAAIPDTLIESELFGHEKGAYTDAISTRKGRFELAHGGTLFLDEIGDMSLSAQSKVLRAIQEMKIERVGGEHQIDVDVRIIAATNKDLAAEVKAGRFREDLFFRLNVIPILIPPLRNRTEDIPLLVSHFFRSFGKAAVRLDAKALQFLQTRPWPGNVRELKNMIERISVLCDEELVSMETLIRFMGSEAGSSETVCKSRETQDTNAENDELFTLPFDQARNLFEKRYIEVKLAKSGYNVARTAEAIGMYPGSLHAKIKKYGIRVDQ